MNEHEKIEVGRKLELDKLKVNHGFHLVVTMITGVWFFGWFIITWKNKVKRDKINDLYNKMLRDLLYK